MYTSLHLLFALCETMNLHACVSCFSGMSVSIADNVGALSYPCIKQFKALVRGTKANCEKFYI